MLLIAVLVLSTNANADPIGVVGGGNLSCGKWVGAINERNEGQQHIFTQWIAGYLVSYNWYRATRHKSTINQPDLETISLWLTTYCNNNPTDLTINAAAALVQHLGGEGTLFKWKE